MTSPPSSSGGLPGAESLYTGVLLDHARQPRHSARLALPTLSARADNPLCGDLVELDLCVVDGRVAEVSVRVRGCAIATGAGSLVAEVFQGRAVEELPALSVAWRAALEASPSLAEPHLPAALAPTRAVLSVRGRPSRHACARLVWDALDAALAGGAACTTK
jgi:nitrogen fixation protein NifU and related proteins